MALLPRSPDGGRAIAEACSPAAPAVLVRLLSTQYRATPAPCARLIAALAQLPENHAALEAAGGIPALVPLLGTPRADQWSLKALSLLCSGREQAMRRAAVAAAGGIPRLARCATSDPRPDMRLQAALLLSQVACDCTEQLRAIEGSGASEAVLRMLAARGPGQQDAAAVLQALQSLQPPGDAANSDAEPAASLPVVHPQPAAGTLAPAAQPAASTLAPTAQVAASMLAPVGQQAVGPPTPEALSAAGASTLAASQVLEAAQAPPAGSKAKAEAQPADAATKRRTCAATGCNATHCLRRCGGCGVARYCSDACSRAHWRVHRAECRRLQAEQAADDERCADATVNRIV